MFVWNAETYVWPGSDKRLIKGIICVNGVRSDLTVNSKTIQSDLTIHPWHENILDDWEPINRVEFKHMRTTV